MTTPGTVLAAARKAAGLSVADVAAQMRLSPRQVEALEADRYGDLPGAVFVRGFIRNYARVLKVDPVPLLQALEPELADDAPLRVQATSGALPVRRNHAKPLFVVFCMIVIAVLVAGGYELWSRHGEQAAEKAPDAAASRASRSEVSEKVRQPAPAVVTPPDATREPAQQPQTTNEPAVASATIDPAPPVAAQPTPSARMAQLRVQFAGSSWIEVRDREGGLIYSGTGQAGSERVFEAIAPLSVVVGNASGVRITYNDQALDLSPYAARNIARLTLE